MGQKTNPIGFPASEAQRRAQQPKAAEFNRPFHDAGSWSN
jgi:hypothetical protein